MVGRLQRAMVLVQLALLAIWVVGFWPEQPGWAVAGPVLMVGGWLGILAFEFMLLVAVRRRDPLVPAGTGDLLRAGWQEAWAAARVFLWWQPWREHRWPDRLDDRLHRGRRAVILVHGFACNRAVWTRWMQGFHEADQPFVALSLEPVFGSIDALAPALDEAVRRARAATGVKPLVVCHSMGGLAARAWLARHPQAAGSIHRLATLGTPHAGTWLAHWSSWPNAVQMRPGGAWLDALRQTEISAVSGSVEMACWYSNCDNVVMPPMTALHPDASAYFVPGIGHVALVVSPQVRAAVLEWGLS